MKELLIMRKSEKGFTLTELMVAVAIFLLAISGILVSYITCLELAELSKNASIAAHSVKSKVEEIKNTMYSQVAETYHNVSFSANGLNGMGVSYVDESDPDLLHITLVFCWRQPSGRVIGEDKDLDGQLDGGEDANGNGRLDSVVEIETYLFNR